MPSFLPRGLLTDYLITQLTSAGLLVGDGEAPDAGGWDDDPNLPTSSYIPYVVLNPMAAAEPTGPLGDTSADFRVPYSVTAAGISRKQVETYADIGRKKITDLTRVVIQLSGENWKIQQARANSIGGVVRSDTVEPSEFTQSDVVIVYISKEN